MEVRCCKKCGAERPLTDFRFNHGHYEHTCPVCRFQQHKAWSANNKDRRSKAFQAWIAKNRERRNAWKRAWRKKNRDRVVAGQRAHYQRNRKHILEAQKKAIQESPEKMQRIRERSDAWRKADRERYDRYRKEQYRKHSNSIKKRAAVWRRANPERAAEAKRRCYEAKREQYVARHKAYEKANRERFKDTRNAVTRNRRARIKQAPGKHTAADIRRLFESQQGLCACCAVDISKGYDVDHVMPIKLGGSNGPDNLQLLCQKCNRRKNDLHPDEWMRRVKARIA
jgi:5-methylcytosine-specific restriction endonuclease McrA